MSAHSAASPHSLVEFGRFGPWRIVSNLLVALSGHALYYFVFRSSTRILSDDSTLLITIVSSAWWLAVCHGSSFAAELLDRRYYRAKSPSSPSYIWSAKLQNTHLYLQRTPPTIGFWTMWTTCILNELFACVVFGLFFVYADIAAPAKRSLAWFDVSSSALVAFAGTVAYVLAIAAAYDLVFFVGHFAMHRVPGLYRATHKLHHLSHADSGISHHYMGAIDFWLETVLPCCLPVLVFGMHVPGWFAFIGMGAWNGVVVHSGYDLPFCPNPLLHLAHHRKGNVNFSLGILDALCGTTCDGELALIASSCGVQKDD